MSVAASLALAATGAVGALPASGAPSATPAPRVDRTVDVDRYPQGAGADLGGDVVAYGLTPATAPTAGAQETGTTSGRAFWRTNPAAGGNRIDLTVAGDFAGRFVSSPGYLVVDHAPDDALTLRASGADGTAVTLAGEPGPAPADGWATTVFALPAGSLQQAVEGAAQLSLGSSGDAAVTVAGVRLVVQGRSVDLGPTIAEHGITVRAGDGTDGLTTGTADGRGYWQTGTAKGTSFVYANVDDGYLLDTRDRTIVDVVYQDAGNAKAFLQYDSPGDTIPDMFKVSSSLQAGDSGEWRDHTWLLDDAIYTNRSNGSDFRLSVEGSPADLRVDSLAVTDVPTAVDPTVALRRLVTQARVTLGAAREGDRDGQYPVGSTAVLSDAIDAAQAVVDDDAPSGDAVESAIDALQSSLETFLSAQVSTDLARGAAASASSGAAAALTDGDDGTAWTSDPGATAWAQVDLGRVRAVDEVTARWTADYAHVYRVQVSRDGRSFTTVATAGALGGGPIRTRFDATSARYVRLQLDGTATQRASYGLTSLEVRDTPVTAVHAKVVTPRYATDDVVVADFDVTDFGADPRGRADSTVAIQRALYACQDAGGGTVWMPAGTYEVTDTLEVSAYCTLRGDYRDPDASRRHGEPSGYGTVVVADLASGDDGPALFRIGGSAGVRGVTTYYPHQSATNPVPYNDTFQIPGLAWVGNENYMMGTVQDVTMLNSYRGIGISTMPNDRGEGPGAQGHELANVRNVSGTVLYQGAAGYNGADVGVWDDVRFDNSYWASAGRAFHAPARRTLDAWTRAHGTGLVLADLEWDQLTNVHLADYQTGIHVTKGPRASFTGAFVDADVRRTDVAVLVDTADDRWGLSFASSRLEGSQASVRNQSSAYVKLTDTTTKGATEGTVYRLAGPSDVPALTPSPSVPTPKARLYDVTSPRYGVPRTPKQFSSFDATRAIQRALDDAGRAGGGVVYLPAGWYTVRGHLTVPRGVELRGSSAVPNRDSLVESSGTVLVASEGRDTAHADTATALVTLAGKGAGVRGLRVLYPSNNPASSDGVVPFPYAIRGDAPDVYVVNVGMENAWNAVDMTRRADGFVVQRLIGAYFSTGVHAGANRGGTVDGVLSNGNVLTRMAYGLPGWVQEADLFGQVIDAVQRKDEALVRADGSRDLTIRNSFSYGAHDGLVARGAEVTAFDLGTDNLGEDGYTVDADAASRVTAVNLMRFNGTTSRGPVTVVNPMAISMVEHAVSVTATTGGTARIVGNETTPGRYEAGSTITLVASARRGYRFVGWRDADGTTVASQVRATITVDADLALIAVFARG